MKPVSSLPVILLGLCCAVGSGCKAKTADSVDDAADLAPAGQGCAEMRCVDPAAVCCNDEPCVDLTTNPQHCGACGRACRSLESCVNGRCVCRAGGREESCPAGLGCCPDRPAFSGGCKNLDNDAAHCGSCGRSCRSGETCVGGSCRCAMGPGCTGAQTCCPGGCANLQDDARNCGSCGRQCPAGKACKGGVCEGECMGCAMGETCCDGKCVNLLNDNTNCGMCGKKCPEFFGVALPCLFGFCVDFGGDMGPPRPPDGFPGDM